MEHFLDENTCYTYIYRLYPEYGTLRYVFAMPISYRGNGEWEAHAWNSLTKLWPEAPLSVFPEILLWIYRELKAREKMFLKLTGTFEIDRLKAYRRLFRKHIELVELRQVSKVYNGAILQAAVVSMVPVEG